MSLSNALEHLVTIAVEAGLDAGAARQEGEQLAAAIAESGVGAYLDWCTEVGVPVSAETFMTAASKGRKWRTTPIPTSMSLQQRQSPKAAEYVSAVVDLCIEAATLGQGSTRVVEVAHQTIAVQTQPATAGYRSGPQPAPPGVRREEEDVFLARAPQIFDQLISQLKENQQRILDLSSMSADIPGAYGSLGRSPQPPPAGPGTPPPATNGMGTRQPEPVAAVQAAAPAPQTATATEAEPAKPEKTTAELLAELDELIGLTRVKAEIHRQAAVLRVEGLRSKAGLKTSTITRHLIFTGNPGTGKTTVARLVAGIYKALGLLSKGQLVEVDRSELVAGYVGQTAMKTAEVVAKAVGGVLFIDEAYALTGDQYGDEAVNTLVKEMEDKRDDLVVIVAGYPAPMAEFISQNPGLESRFRTTIEFENYTDEELRQIFAQMVRKADYDLGEGSMEAFVELLGNQIRDERFGNARFARNVFEAAISQQAWRLRNVAEPTIEELRTILPCDIATETVPWPPEHTPSDVPSQESADPASLPRPAGDTSGGSAS